MQVIIMGARCTSGRFGKTESVVPPIPNLLSAEHQVRGGHRRVYEMFAVFGLSQLEQLLSS